jgi:hypothetical protein
MLLTHARLGRTWVLSALVCLLVLAAGFAAARPAAAAAGTFQFRSVACSSGTSCTATGGNPVLRSEAVTFDPSSTGLTLDPAPFFNNRVDKLSCASSTQCVAVGWTSESVEHGSARAAVFDPSSPSAATEIALGGEATNATDVSCPSQTECTALVLDFGQNGGARAVTFNPTTGAVKPPVTLASAPLDVRSLACPSTSQCTAAGFKTVTFDPSSGATKSTGPQLDANARLACPSVTQCTAGWAGGGIDGAPRRAQELTFDPTTATATSAGTVRLGSEFFSLLACAAVSQCSVVEGVAASVHPTLQTFDPISGSAASPVDVVPLAADMACPSTSLCVIVTYEGKVLGYDPSTGAHRTIGTVSSASGGSAAAVLGSALVPSGAAATIGAILNAGAYPATVSAPGPGTAGVTWYYVPPGAHVASTRKPIVVASGTKTFKKAGKAKLRITLSRTGRKLLKAAKKSIALTSKGTFTPKRGKRVSSKRTFKLKR